MNTRRSLAGGAAAALLGTAGVSIASQEHLDATLLALCAEFERLEREFLATDFEATPYTPEADHADAEQRRISDKQSESAGQICACKITTLDGARALARTMALNDLELFRQASPYGYTNQRLLGALVGGLIGWPADARQA